MKVLGVVSQLKKGIDLIPFTAPAMDTKLRTRVGIVATEFHSNYVEQLATELENRIPTTSIIKAVAAGSLATATFSSDDLEKLQSVEILVGDPRLFNRCLAPSSNVKWLQSFWAGVDGFVRKSDEQNKLQECILTRNGSSFVDSMAQYYLLHILARERNFLEHHHNQQKAMWKGLTYRSMSSLSVGILGVGEIGREFARLAKALDMTVWGLVRTKPTADHQCPHVDHYRLKSDLAELLSACDYICAVLPSTPDTDGLLDGDILSNCKGSVLINAGRGNIIKEESILKALSNGWLSHAVLDVFEKEPLPSESKLWFHPKVTVTPHIAGVNFDVKEFAEAFTENYARYKAGTPLKWMVDWSSGY